MDFTQEPKKAFLGFLIDRMKVANYFLYVNINDAKGLDVLDGLIDSLNETSQKALEKEHEEIVVGAYGRKRVDARALYSKVYKYLASTYLEECNFSVVPTSTLKAENDAPSEKIPVRAKATL